LAVEDTIEWRKVVWQRMASADPSASYSKKMIDPTGLTQSGRPIGFSHCQIPPAVSRRPQLRIRALGLLAVLALPGWLLLADPLGAAEATTAFEVKIETGVVFTAPEMVELHCDIYSPVAREESAKGRPAILLIHGGAWSSGSRRGLGGYALRLARNGFVAIAIDYRLAPRWKFPAQVDDVRTAIRWMSDHSEPLGIDPSRIGIFGYSAGGHLACLIGTLVDEPLETQASASLWPLNDQRLQNPIKPAAICAGGPPCDLMNVPGGLAFFLGGSPQQIPEVYTAASPLTHASAGDIPTLVIHGLADSIVPVQCSKSLYQSQRDLGVASEFLAFEAQGHLLTFLNPKTAESMVDFFRRKLNHPPAP
jgi:acetyl esterase/lipase